MNVEITALSKAFGATPALNGVSLSVAEGEFLALLGPSGSGKTSLLRMLAGLEFPDSGEIMIGGRSMAGVPARERGIGFVFQHYALFRHMTVHQNVAFGLEVRPRLSRPSKLEIEARVNTFLALMEIGDLAGRYPDQISGGQRQRVALARALATEPGLLLLDEPFGALDAKVRKSLRIWLRSLHKRMGLTSIFVTHDQAEAMEMADRIAVMRAGRIEQVDVPERLYADPANEFVHEFLGESVRVDCTVQDGFARFDRLPVPAVATDFPNGPAIALIRPHEIELSAGAGPARIRSVHTAGPLQRITISLASQEFEVTRAGIDWIPNVGETCEVSLSRAKLYHKNSEFVDPGSRSNNEFLGRSDRVNAAILDSETAAYLVPRGSASPGSSILPYISLIVERQ